MKIHSLELMAQIAAELRKGGSRIVLANGCFDCLHIGHIKHLEAARRMGDCLMVTVTRDEQVGREKGHGRPLFNIRERLASLAALDCVNYVAMNTDKPGQAIGMIRPALYVKGHEYWDNMTPQLMQEKLAVEEVGGKLSFTDTAEWHSSEIIKKLG